MELKLLFLTIFMSGVSTRATVETELLEEYQHLSSNYEEEEDFLDDIDQDLDYFYTYEAIKNLQTMTLKLDNESDASVDIAEKFFLNFLTDDDYEGDEDDYSYGYEDAMDNVTESEAMDSYSYNYTELDEIAHDDFVYFDTLEDFVGPSSEGSKVSRDTVLLIILAAVVVLVLVFLLLLCLRSPKLQNTEWSEEEEPKVGDDNLLKEIV